MNDETIVISRREFEAREAAIASALERNRHLENIVAERDRNIADAEKVIADRGELITSLRLTVEKLQRMLFGSRRERFTVPDGQILLPFLADPDLVRDAVVKERRACENERRAPRKKSPGRLPLPKFLPVEEILIEPDQDVSAMTRIDQEVTDELGYTPARFFIRRFVRPVYIAPADDDLRQRSVVAPLPPRLIERCLASDELLATIIVNKHLLHLPIYRQLQEFARLGVEIPSSTVDSWQRLLAETLRPLHAALRVSMPKQGYRQIDESPIRVIDRARKGVTAQGWMWAYHAPLEKIILFDYRKGRSREHCRDMLEGFNGYLQTDAHGAYTEYKARSEVVPLGCWAHARRKFDEARTSDPDRADVALALIRRLYAVESEARERGLSHPQRKELRLERSLPVLNTLGAWLATEIDRTLPKSPIGRAVRYVTALWEELQNYLLDGALEIDNNLIENAIRPLALGRKNYLFAGSHVGAEIIAMYRSFLATCRLAGHDPYAWLLFVMRKLPVTPPERYATLLPQNVPDDLLRLYQTAAESTAE